MLTDGPAHLHKRLDPNDPQTAYRLGQTIGDELETTIIDFLNRRFGPLIEATAQQHGQDATLPLFRIISASLRKAAAEVDKVR